MFMFKDFKKILKYYIKESIISVYSLRLKKTELKKIKSYQKVKIAHNRLPDTVVNKLDIVMMSIIHVIKRKHEEDIIEILHF